eukprot:scaffold4229_cov38-Cyclotella_meneghiniana.AAC.9
MSLVAKRRPFGTAAANAAAVVKGNKEDGRNRKPRSIKSSPKATKPKPSAPTVKSKLKHNQEEKPRKSKTPKMHNLSSIGGAYDFQADFVEKKLSNDGTARKKAVQPDPSPVKRPDPTSKAIKSNCSSSAAPPTNKLQPLTPKLINHRDSFIQSSLGRLFKPSQPFSGRRSITSRCTEREASSDMDVDSECSSPEKTSPLVTSPYNKPDPEPIVENFSVEAADNVNKARLSNNGTAKTVALQKAKIDKNNVLSRSTINSTTADKTQPPNKANTFAAADSNAKGRQLQSQISDEVLQRARNGPADNRRVLDAMLNSSNAKAAVNHNDLTKSGDSSLVGLTIGGLSLQRCASEDCSEVTMPNLINETTRVRAQPSSETSSIFRNREDVSDPIINDFASSHFIRYPTNDEREQLSVQIRSQLQSGYTLPSQIYLPAGWQVRMSKSKGKPYYVHPDFGSTWHYPGLIVGPHIAVQNRLYRDEDASRFTSQASGFHKSNDAMQSSSGILRGSINNVSRRLGSEGIDRSETGQTRKHSSDLISSAGKRSDDAVNSQAVSPKNSQSAQNGSHSELTSSADKGSDDAVNSQTLSLDATQSKCLTQDSFVNGYTENDAMQELKEAVDDCIVQEDGSDINASFLSTKSNMSDVATLEIERNDNSGDFVDGNFSAEENNDIDFGAEHDSFDDCDIEESKDETKFTVNDEDDSLLGLDFADNEDLDIRQDNNSLASDHVDVEALLRHRAPASRDFSPLATMKEIMQDSSGKKSTSSRVSLDESSLDCEDPVEETSPKASKFQSSSLVNDLSQASNDFEKESSSETSHGHQSFVDGEDDSGNDGFDIGGDGFSDEENLTTDNDTNDDVFNDKLDNAVDTSAKQHVTKRKRRKAIIKTERRKTFPPGPLCSLQMLDLVEEGSLNTPLWRNAKRKRCTLTSLKRSQKRKKVGRSSH